MRTKLATTFFGLLGTAAVIMACQPMLDDDGSSTGIRAVSAEGSHDPGPATTAANTTTRPVGSTTEPAGTTPTTSVVAPDPPSSPGGDIEREWYGTGPKVAILGDSLTVQARPHLRELAGGSYALKIGALYGEGVSGGALSINLPEPIMPAVIDQYAEDPPDVVVLALGTNDVWQRQIGLASFEREWHSATRSFPDACIVGVTATETDEAWMYDPDEARQINRVIRRTVDVVVDWSSRGSSDRYTDTDHIHLTAEGRAHFAELVMAGVDRCAAR